MKPEFKSQVKKKIRQRAHKRKLDQNAKNILASLERKINDARQLAKAEKILRKHK